MNNTEPRSCLYTFLKRVPVFTPFETRTRLYTFQNALHFSTPLKTRTCGWFVFFLHLSKRAPVSACLYIF